MSDKFDDDSMFPKANILIIDDSDALRKTMKKILTRSGVVEFCFEARSGLEGLKILMEKKVDLVICDVVMPEFDGFKFLASKSGRPEFVEIPVIMLTSEEDVTQKIKSMEQGASDYIVKPFDEGEILARVKVQLKIKFLQDELKKKNTQLQELAGTDQLTGIANRRRFMEFFETEFSRAKRYKNNLSFAIFDVDFFKQVNDRFGHLVGDQVLIQIAQRMRQGIRLSDTLGRYGGDELILLLPQTDLQGAFPLAERVRKQIESFEFVGASDPLRLTLSGGVASYPEVSAATVDELLRKADEALYRAKANGRNRIESAR